MVKDVWLLTGTHWLLLAGTNVQVPWMEPPLRVLLLVLTTPVTAVLVSVTTSPAALVMVNENEPLVNVPAELYTRLVNVPAGVGMVAPKQVSAFSS